MATTATIRVEQETGFPPPLALAFALGEPKGKLGGPLGVAQRPRARPVPAGAGPAVWEEICRAKRRCGWPEEARGGRGCRVTGIPTATARGAEQIAHKKSRAGTHRVQCGQTLPTL